MLKYIHFTRITAATHVSNMLEYIEKEREKKRLIFGQARVASSMQLLRCRVPLSASPAGT